jgi:hypothetical protein
LGNSVTVEEESHPWRRKQFSVKDIGENVLKNGGGRLLGGDILGQVKDRVCPFIKTGTGGRTGRTFVLLSGAGLGSVR